LAQLLRADFREELRSIAQQDRRRTDRIPHAVAEATQAGEVLGNAIPVGALSHIIGGAELDQPLGVDLNRAAVDGFKLQRGLRRERAGQFDYGFVKLPGMIDVAIENLPAKDQPLAIQAHVFKLQRRGYLQGDDLQRLLPVIP